MKKIFVTGLLGLTLALTACGSNSTTIVDGSKPSVKVSGVDSTGKMTVDVTPVKNAVVKSVAIYDNGKLVTTDTAAPYSTTLNYTAASNGKHVIKAVVTDSSDATTEASQTVTVSVPADTTKPTVALAAVPATISTNTAVALVATATDNMGIKSVVFYDNDKQVAATASGSSYSATLNYTAADNGRHVIKAVATDTSGNTTESAAQTIQVDIQTDKEGPKVQISAPSAVTVAGTVTLSAEASDNVAVASVAFYDNDQPLNTAYKAPYTATVTYTSANNGTHTVRAVATDNSGNQTESKATYNVSIAAASADTVKPSVTLSLDPSTINSNTWSAVNLSGKASDNVGISKVTLALSVGGKNYTLGDAALAADGTFGYRLTPANLGEAGNTLLAGLSSVTITATATDTSGNTSEQAAQTLTITH